jgi:opacity protein-like surface antigen
MAQGAISYRHVNNDQGSIMKKIALISSILAASISTAAIANGVYLGPSVLVKHISASHSSYNGLNPRLSLGYGDMMNESFYLAGEIFAAPITATFSDIHRNGAQSTKITRSFGASIIPGMLLNEQLIGYLRFGVISSKFSGPNVTKTGGQIGFGLQGALTETISLRGEYNYTAYKKISGLGSPKTNEVGIGLMFKFA